MVGRRPIKFLDKKQFDAASFHNKETELSQLILNLSRSGSNSLVVDKNRSATGNAFIVNDPHVGLFLPNFWLIAGIKTENYHVVGLMIPGLPFFGLGRNPQVSWGGTNMRGISSHLYDVSSFPQDKIRVKKETIERRWWWSKEVDVRHTDFGPILSDLDYFSQENRPQVAIDWIGRDGSDELTGFLAASRAKNWDEFSSAFKDYEVSAQNMLYADSMGNIGMVLAYGQPVLKNPEETLKLIKDPSNPIVGTIPSNELPFAYNPDSGIIASANNQPFSNTPIPIGHGFAPNDRFERMISLADEHKKLDLEGLKKLQKDVFSQSAFKLKSLYQETFSRLELMNHPIAQKISAWDGRYLGQSQAAASFEIFSYFAWQGYVESQKGSSTVKDYLRTYGGWKRILTTWFQEKPQSLSQELVKSWLERSREKIGDQALTWGDIHQQTMQSPLGMIPLVGSRFQLQNFEADGGNDTLYKAGRRFSPDPEGVTYGSSARHISDMSDIDGNYFVLFGGQDGWLNNPNLTDQLELWKQGQYIKVPLTMAKVRNQFIEHQTLFTPAP